MLSIQLGVRTFTSSPGDVSAGTFEYHWATCVTEAQAGTQDLLVASYQNLNEEEKVGCLAGRKNQAWECKGYADEPTLTFYAT